MSLPRRMSAGLPCNTIKVRGVNVNQIQFGDKLQGLPPVTGRGRPYKSIRAKEGGNLPDRERIYCINQLGGIGLSNKNSQFAANADGVGNCPNKKNKRGHHGLHRKHHHPSEKHPKRGVSRATETSDYDPNMFFNTFAVMPSQPTDSNLLGSSPMPGLGSPTTGPNSGAGSGLLGSSPPVPGSGSPITGASADDNVCPLDYPYAYSGGGGVIKKPDGTTVNQPQNSKDMWCCSVDTDDPNTCRKDGVKGKIRTCSETEWVSCKDNPSVDPGPDPPSPGKNPAQCGTKSGEGKLPDPLGPDPADWDAYKDWVANSDASMQPKADNFSWDANKENTLIAGAWLNSGNTAVSGIFDGSAVNPQVKQMSGQNNFIMLASYCPNPWDPAYCTNPAFTMNILNWCDIKTAIVGARYGLPGDAKGEGARPPLVKDKNVKALISIGGSSFGPETWCYLIFGGKSNPSMCSSGGSGGGGTQCDCPSHNAQWVAPDYTTLSNPANDRDNYYAETYLTDDGKAQYLVIDPEANADGVPVGLCGNKDDNLDGQDDLCKCDKSNPHLCRCKSGYIGGADAATGKWTCETMTHGQCIPPLGGTKEQVEKCWEVMAEQGIGVDTSLKGDALNKAVAAAKTQCLNPNGGGQFGCTWQEPGGGGGDVPTCSKDGATCTAPSSANKTWPNVAETNKCSLADEHATSTCTKAQGETAGKCGCPFTTGKYQYGAMAYHVDTSTGKDEWYEIDEKTSPDSIGLPIGTLIPEGAQTAAGDLIPTGSISGGAAPMMVHVLSQTQADGFDLDFEGGIPGEAMGVGLTLLCYLMKNYAKSALAETNKDNMINDRATSTKGSTVFLGEDGKPIFTYTPQSGPGAASQGTIPASAEGKMFDQYLALVRSLYTLGGQSTTNYDRGTYPPSGTSPSGYTRPKGSGPGGWLMQSFLYEACPYDYVVPMLYNGGQYGYCPEGCKIRGWTEQSPAFSWNGLLDFWCGVPGTKTGVGNPPKLTYSKLLPAFITYNGTAQGSSFCKYDFERFLEEYLIPSQNSKDPKTWERNGETLNKMYGSVFFTYGMENYENDLTNDLVESLRYVMSGETDDAQAIFKSEWVFNTRNFDGTTSDKRYGAGLCGTFYNGQDCSGKKSSGSSQLAKCSEAAYKAFINKKCAAADKESGEGCISAAGYCDVVPPGGERNPLWCTGWDPKCCVVPEDGKWPDTPDTTKCDAENTCTEDQICIPTDLQVQYPGWCGVKDENDPGHNPICGSRKGPCSDYAPCECGTEAALQERCDKASKNTPGGWNKPAAAALGADNVGDSAALGEFVGLGTSDCTGLDNCCDFDDNGYCIDRCTKPIPSTIRRESMNSPWNEARDKFPQTDAVGTGYHFPPADDGSSCRCSRDAIELCKKNVREWASGKGIEQDENGNYPAEFFCDAVISKPESDVGQNTVCAPDGKLGRWLPRSYDRDPSGNLKPSAFSTCYPNPDNKKGYDQFSGTGLECCTDLDE